MGVNSEKTDVNKKTLLYASKKIQRRWPANLAPEDRKDYDKYRACETLDSYISNYRNVWLSPDSVIYKNGLLVTDTVASPDYTVYYRFRHLARKYFTGKKVRFDKHKQYLLVTDSWSVGHFHWFCDVLPKLINLGNRAETIVLLLPDHPYIHKVAIDSLDLLGLKFSDIVFMKERDFYYVPDLLYINKVAPCGQMDDELMSGIRKKIIGDSVSGNRYIYISRAKARCRKVLNEEKLCRLLHKYDFEIILPEEMKLREQIKEFSSCQTIMGIHGAGLTGCIFMPSGGNLIELKIKESAGANGMYWQLADSLGHHYYYYNGKADSTLPLMGNGCNLEISLPDFENKVLQHLPIK